MPWLINAAQVDKFRKNQKSLIILDASYHIDGRDGKQEFIENHIMGAQFFDLREFNDPHAELPNALLLDEKLLSEKLGKLGIRNDYKIIFYDRSDLHSACRALWMFKLWGHNPHLLYVLDGGFSAWEAYNGKVQTGPAATSNKPYTARLDLTHLRTLQDIKNNLQFPLEQIVDMRHPVRYAGGPEHRPGLRCGHIPGSFCFPYQIMFEKNGCFLPLEKIRRKLIDVGLDLGAPMTTLCGSGVTAAILNFLLDLMSLPAHALYAGSWLEYGAEKLYAGEKDLSERPVATCVD